MKRVNFIISFDLNLFFHLEALSGSVPQRFSKKYASRFPEFNELAKKFKWEFDPQTISWHFKKRIEESNAFEKGGLEFGKKIKRMYQKAKELYKPYWEREIKSKLEKFKEELKEKREWIESTISKIEKLTGISFGKKVNIYLIEALSQEYGLGAEPLPNGIAIGRIKDQKLLKLVITHELVHLNLMDKIIKIIPAKYAKDETKINEAITDLITYRVLKMPPPKKVQSKVMGWVKKEKIKDLQRLLRKVLDIS